MAYNPSILKDVLQARSLSKQGLSKRLGIDLDQLEAELRRSPEPKQSVLNSIAKELALPPFVFYMEKAPPLSDVLPDFRSESASPTAKSKPTVETIQLADAIQRAAIQVGGPGVSNLPYVASPSAANVDQIALQARTYFDITLEDQIDSKDAREFYLVCRKKIEDKGIFVIQETFPEEDGSGFCLSHPMHPVIVVNTKRQNRGRRLFTLIHELAHILLKRSGISDPMQRNNAVERWCNQFAGAFLVPKPYLSQLRGVTPPKAPTPDDVAWASRRLKISQEASVLRLEQLGSYASGSHKSWRQLMHNSNPDYITKSGGPPGSGPPPQNKVKLAKYGFHFAQVFRAPLEKSTLSEINLFRSSGLKPKYQRPYFDLAKSIKNPDELRALELEDD